MQFQRHPFEPTYGSNNASSDLLSPRSSLQDLSQVSPRATSKWAKSGRGWLPTSKLISENEDLKQQKVEKSSSKSSASITQKSPLPDKRNSVIKCESTKALTETAKKSHREFVQKANSEKALSNKKSQTAIEPKKQTADELVEERTTIFKKKKRNVQFQNPSKTYPRWEFGKVKTFVRPESTLTTNAAATMITKHVRGWWKRLNFRIKLVKYRLQTVDERADAKIKQYQMSVQIEKTKAATELHAASKKLDKQIRQGAETLKEANQLVAYLRKQNAKLREKNKKLATSIVELREHNERLADATGKGGDATVELQKYAKQIEETHEKLKTVVPKYEDSIKQLQDAVDVRNRYSASEKTIRLLYTNLLGQVVVMMQSNYLSRDPDLVNDIVEQVLDVEAAIDLPKEDDENQANKSWQPSASQKLELDNDDSEEDYDEYTVHTFDESFKK